MGEDAMFVVAPCGEARQVIENLFRIRVENVWAVFVDEDASCVIFVVGISADVATPIAEEDGFTEAAPQPLREDASRESGADNEIIEGAHIRRRRFPRPACLRGFDRCVLRAAARLNPTNCV